MSGNQRKGRGQKAVLNSSTLAPITPLKLKEVRQSQPEQSGRTKKKVSWEVVQPNGGHNLRQRFVRQNKENPSSSVNPADQLEKNRRIAKECRERKNLRHEYLEILSESAEEKNLALRKELKQLHSWAVEMDLGVVPYDLVLYRQRWDPIGSEYQKWRTQVGNASYTQLNMLPDWDIENIADETNNVSSTTEDNIGSEAYAANTSSTYYVDIPPSQCTISPCRLGYVDDCSDEETFEAVSPVEILPNFDYSG